MRYHLRGRILIDVLENLRPAQSWAGRFFAKFSCCRAAAIHRYKIQKIQQTQHFQFGLEYRERLQRRLFH